MINKFVVGGLIYDSQHEIQLPRMGRCRIIVIASKYKETISGETCHSLFRVFVQDSLYQEHKDKLFLTQYAEFEGILTHTADVNAIVLFAYRIRFQGVTEWK